MKASERLRELDGGMEPAPWGPKYWNEPDRVGLSALRNALPLIADVVEAAEQVIANNAYPDKLADALTALRDALQPEPVEPPAPDPKLVRWASGKRGSPPPPEGTTAP